MQDITSLTNQAMRHWERWLPQKTADLKEAGTFEMRARQAAERAHNEIGILMKSGLSQDEAEEMVLPEYITLSPELGVM